MAVTRVTGVNKFPNDPILVKLLEAARCTSGVAISDVLGYEKTYQELLADILQTRSLLLDQLPRSALKDADGGNILREESQYVSMLANGGYEFIVAFFAIRALGGAPVPLATGVHPEEAQYFLSKAKATCIVASQELMDKASNIIAHIQRHGNNSGPFALSPISCDSKLQGEGEGEEDVDVQIDETLAMDPLGPGIVLFTSGSTGQPKGVVLPRRAFTNGKPAAPNTAILNTRPGHWVGGFSTLMIPILGGRRLYCIAENTGAEAMLEALMKHRITMAAFPSTLWRKMKDVITDGADELSEEDVVRHAFNFRHLTSIAFNASPIEPAVRDFWVSLTGLQMSNAYGGTEMGGIVCSGTSATHGSIGKPLPHSTIKLSEGDHGEILVKSRNMLTHYLDDEEKTKEAFDEEGYYKTGDTAMFKDGEYIFTGRANADFIYFRSFRIPALLVERSLLGLPYISEACVLGIPYYEAKNLCGAIVRLKEGCESSAEGVDQINLAKIRSDLHNENLSVSMQPVVLRILRDGEVLPLTSSEKPIKKQIAKDFFGTTDSFPVTDIPPGVEYCGSELKIVPGESKLWDLGGLQC